MSNQTKILKNATLMLRSIAILATLLLLLFVYLSYTKTLSADDREMKNSFIKLTTLPDLAFVSDEGYLRHRSLNTVFKIYDLDTSLREHSQNSFTITHKELY